MICSCDPQAPGVSFVAVSISENCVPFFIPVNTSSGFTDWIYFSLGNVKHHLGANTGYTLCCIVVLNDTRWFLNFSWHFLLANTVTQRKKTRGSRAQWRRDHGGRLVRKHHATREVITDNPPRGMLAGCSSPGVFGAASEACCEHRIGHKLQRYSDTLWRAVGQSQHCPDRAGGLSASLAAVIERA